MLYRKCDSLIQLSLYRILLLTKIFKNLIINRQGIHYNEWPGQMTAESTGEGAM